MGWLRRVHRGGDTGAAAVEAALIIPLILLLTFGITELALLLRDYVGASNLVRDAARTASTNPRVGNVPGHQGPAVPARPTAQPSFAYLASQTLLTSGSALPEGSISEMWVYLANPKGYPTQSANWQADTSGSISTCPPAYCVRYRFYDPDGAGPQDPAFLFQSGSWDPASVNACAGDPDAQAVGIYLRVAHQGIIKTFFDATMDVSDRSVVKFEPMRVSQCEP